MRIIVRLITLCIILPAFLHAADGDLKLRKDIECRFELDQVPNIPQFEGMIYLRIGSRRFFVTHTQMPNLENINEQPEHFGHIAANLREKSLAACVNFNQTLERYYLAVIEQDILYINGPDGRPLKATALDPTFIESILEAEASPTPFAAEEEQLPIYETPSKTRFTLQQEGRITKLYLHWNNQKFFIDNADLTKISHSIKEGQVNNALAECTLFDGNYRQTAYWAKKIGQQIEIYNDSELVKTIALNATTSRKKSKPKLLPKDIYCQFAIQHNNGEPQLFILFGEKLYPVCTLNGNGTLQINEKEVPTTIASASYFDRTSYSRSFKAEWFGDEILVYDSELSQPHQIFIGPLYNKPIAKKKPSKEANNNWQSCTIKEYGLQFEHPWKGISVFGKGPKYKLTNYLDIIVEPYCNSETRFPELDHKIKQKRMTSIQGNVFLQGHYFDERGAHYYYKTTHNYQCITFVFHLDKRTLTQSTAEKILATIKLN